MKNRGPEKAHVRATLPRRSWQRCHRVKTPLSLASGARILIIAGACVFAACGAQGPPRPPRVEKPERVNDLAATQIGRTLTLRCTPPALATDGERLSKPLTLEIFRSQKSPGSQAAPHAASSLATPWKSIAPGDLARYTQGGKIVVRDPFSEQEFRQSVGGTLEFAVRGVTRSFRGRPIGGDVSKAVEVRLLDVSPAIQGLAGMAQEHAIVLRWTPPGENLTGGAVTNLAGYRVYKSVTGKPDSFTALADAERPSYEDGDFVFGKTYYYRVRALFRSNGQTAESDDSPPFVITPHDIFPPAAPLGLTALYSSGVVELIWNVSPEPDLAGYNVYRREATAGAFTKLNRSLVETPTFRDSTVAPGRRDVYRVTAVDLAGNESAPSAEVEVETQ